MKAIMLLIVVILLSGCIEIVVDSGGTGFVEGGKIPIPTPSIPPTVTPTQIIVNISNGSTSEVIILGD